MSIPADSQAAVGQARIMAEKHGDSRGTMQCMQSARPVPRRLTALFATTATFPQQSRLCQRAQVDTARTKCNALQTIRDCDLKMIRIHRHVALTVCLSTF